MKTLHEKVAFITGGTRGMGAAIVKRLSAAGATVVFTHSGKNEKMAQDVLEAVKANGTKGTAIIADSEDPEAVMRALKETIHNYSTIDILVNNAGIIMNKSIEDYSLAEFDRMMNINVKAVFVASQFAARHMERGGRIITIGSNMADFVGFSGVSLYSMSKSALIGLTKGMARDLGSRSISVNLVQPGPVNTDMNPATSEIAPVLLAGMALKRYGTVEEIAGLVAYLCARESQFITGTSITIDGGLNA